MVVRGEAFAVLFLSVAIPSTAAAARISGIVADARYPYGVRIGIANASISYGAVTAISDADGRFSIDLPDDVEDPDPVLNFEAPGYVPYSERSSQTVAGAFHLIPEDLYRGVYLLVWQRTADNPNNWLRKWEQQPEFVIARSGASDEQIQTLTAILSGDEYRLMTGGRFNSAHPTIVNSKPTGSARYGKTVISFAAGVGGGIAHSEDSNGIINYAEITLDVRHPVDRNSVWHEMVHTVTAGGHINEWPSVVSEIGPAATNGLVTKTDQEILNCIYNSPPRRAMPSVQPTGASQPVVTLRGIVNSASYQPQGAPNSGIAQGSVFVVFGRNLSATGMTRAEAFPLPTELAGTSVQVSVGDTTANAYILYTSPNQVGAMLPSDMPTGLGTLTVAYAGQNSPKVPFQIVSSAFGIFTQNQAGTGPAAAQVFQTPENQPLNSMIQAATPGQIVTLWGTGLGPVEGDEAGRPLPGSLDVGAEAWVGGKPAKVLYAGRSGCCAGVDQIAIEIPDGPSGCYVPVAVRAGGVWSNFATLSITEQGRFCSDPFGFPDTMIEVFSQNRPVKTGIVHFEMRSGPELATMLVPSPERASATFKLNNLPAALASQGPLGTAVSRGHCLVFPCGDGNCLGQDPAAAGLQDAGTGLELSGPAGVVRLLEKTEGVYDGNLAAPGDPSFLQPGLYIVSGQGGKRVGAFQATLTIPATLVQWAPDTEVHEIDRARALTVNWVPGDSERSIIGILGQSVVPGSGATMAFLCMDYASERRLTVPSLVLESLPAGAGTLSLIETVPGLTVAFATQNVDVGYFYLQRISSQGVSFK
ncbi:MAG: hypothetical protein ACE141_10360 [Bryobacteraceae bacterium]